MSNDSTNTPDIANSDILTVIQRLQEQLQAQQEQMHIQQNNWQQQFDLQRSRIKELEASNLEWSGKVVYKNNRATTLKLYDELLERYPAIGISNIFDAELPKDHDAFNMSDFHFTEGTEYKPLPVLEHPEVSLSSAGKWNEAELVAAQSDWAHHTRFYNTFAHEIIQSGEADTELGAKTLSFLNTVCIAAVYSASKISRLRENHYLDELGIKHSSNKEVPLFTLDELTARRAASELVRKTYKKVEPPKDKNKKGDKSNKDKSGTDDKSKDKQSGCRESRLDEARHSDLF